MNLVLSSRALLTIVASLSLGGSASGCKSDKPAEGPGEKVDQAAEDVKDSTKKK